MRFALLIGVILAPALSPLHPRNEIRAPFVPALASSLTRDDTVATFSILAYDPSTGELGGAVQSRVFSVGNGVLWGEAGVGVVATQAIVDVSYGPKALAYLRQGMSAADVVKKVWED